MKKLYYLALSALFFMVAARGVLSRTAVAIGWSDATTDEEKSSREERVFPIINGEKKPTNMLHGHQVCSVSVLLARTLLAEEAESLTAFITRLNKPIDLELIFCDLKKDELRTLLKAIAQGKVKTLKVYQNELSWESEDAVAVSEAVSQSPSLKALEIKMPTLPVSPLIKMLEDNKTLTTLNLLKCDLHDSAAEQLAESLYYNGSLRDIRLQGNELTPVGLSCLQKVCACNPTPRRFSLQGNPYITTELVEAFENQRTKNEHIFARNRANLIGIFALFNRL
jgi:hypothetical protein